MRKNNCLLLCLLFSMTVASLSGCSKDENESDDESENGQPVSPLPDKNDPLYAPTRAVYQGAADMAFPVFAYLNDNLSPDENFTVSPLSLAEAFGMLANGVQGAALSEIKEALGVPGLTVEQMDSAFRYINSYLTQSTGITLKNANSIWFDEGFTVKEQFIDLNRKYFDAEVNIRDLQTESTMSDINRWCSRKTEGTIDRLLSNPLQEGTATVLLNALYFNGKWSEPFDKDKTKTELFTSADGTKSYVQMMNMDGEAVAQVYDKYDVLFKSYNKCSFEMDIILPHGGENLNECLDSFILDKNKFYPRGKYDVSLKMPRFRLKCDKSLVQALKTIGVKGVFNPERSAFIPMTDEKIAVSDIRQVTYISVDEIGTEASAVTETDMCTANAHEPETPPHLDFFMNRPFAYIIRDTYTRAVLFAGRVVKI